MSVHRCGVSIVVTLLVAVSGSAAELPSPFVRAEADLAAVTDGGARVVVDPATSRARLIRLRSGSLQFKGNSVEERAGEFLAAWSDLLGVADAEHDLELGAKATDRFGMTHLEYRQSHGGVPVFGARLKLHFDAVGELTVVNGSLVPDIELDTMPTVPWMRAEAAARAMMAKRHGLASTDLDASTAELLVYRSGLTRGLPGSNHLVWMIEVSSGDRLREAFFIDAHDGSLVDRIDRIHTISRRVYHVDTNTLLWEEGNALPFEGLGATKDPEVNTLIDTASATYDLYANLTGGDFLSYNGNDAPMLSIYEADFLDCPNATWNGATANFCFGFGVDDVVAHEWTHGYTDFNHNLIYAWQPGALNESFSDIFGEIVDVLNDNGLDSPSPPRSVSACSTFGGTNQPTLEVTSPSSIAGIYDAGYATWNPAVWSRSGTVELVDDGTGTATDACEALTGFTSGRIALIDRGSCQFATKALNAQTAGAIAIIVANHEDDSLYTMTGSDAGIEIPGLFIGLSDGQAFKTVEEQGLEVVMGMDSSTDDSVRWLVGEEVTGGPIRDMWNPECLGDPGNVSGARYWCSEDDSGGVHINSGISNHAFALLVDGGTFNGQSIAAIGMTKAAHIYWRAMSVYQTPTTGFADHADLMELSCSDLIGQPITSLSTGATIGDTISASNCNQVAKAMTATDMRAVPPCDFDVILDPNPPDLPTGKVVFSESFSSIPGSEWTISSQGVYPEYNAGQSAWRWTNVVPEGGSGGAFWAINSFFIGNCEPNDDDQSGVTRLESPEIEIPASASGATLVFDHWVATEDGWDGGNLKISVNGAAYQLVPAAAFVHNPYNSSVIDILTIDQQEIENSNPLAGEPAYTGIDQGHVFGGSWGQSQVDLDGLAQPGDTIRLRWDFGIDGCTGFEGWYLDNVKVIAEGIDPLAVRRSSGRRVVPENPF